MKLKAYYKWNGGIAYLKPVFFSYHVGLQMKDDQFGSIFCSRIDEFNYPFLSKILLFIVKIVYYLKMRVWWYIYHRLPYLYMLHFRRTFGMDKDRVGINRLPF